MRTILAAVLASLLLSSCGTLTPASTSSKLDVVAAENFWGSVAAQLAGDRASVSSIVVNPNADPHSYVPTSADARSLATAGLVIVNGIGYDPWAPQLLAADPVDGRATLDVGKLLHLQRGDNPHAWYNPADVIAVARAITAQLQRLDPRDAAYFQQRYSAFATSGLAAYDHLIATIARRYAGVPVGASESIFAQLAPALKLDLLTPPGYMKSVSEGTDVSVQDESAAHAQIDERRIAVWLYNAQNVTPDVQQLNAEATAHGIPVVTITETLSPASASFQVWQTRQLAALAAALHQATGR